MRSKWRAVIQLQFSLCARLQKPVRLTIGVKDMYEMKREGAAGELRWCEFLKMQQIFAVLGL